MSETANPVQTIEEAYAALNPKPGRHYYHGEFTSDAEKARALALASVREAEALEQYTCHVACDHGEECRTTQRAALRARIEAL